MKTEISQERILRGFIKGELERQDFLPIVAETISWDVQDTERNDETEVYFYVSVADKTAKMRKIVELLARLLGVGEGNFVIDCDWVKTQSRIQCVVTIPDRHTHGVAGDFWVCSERDVMEDGELHVVASFDTEDGALSWLRSQYLKYRLARGLRAEDFTWQKPQDIKGVIDRTECYDNKSNSPYGYWIVDHVEIGDGDAEAAKESEAAK